MKHNKTHSSVFIHLGVQIAPPTLQILKESRNHILDEPLSSSTPQNPMK
jgi:hypothetical protein